MNSILDKEITYVSGVGPRKAASLKAELGIRTYMDMLTHIPHRYIDKSKIFSINEILEKDDLVFVQIQAKVLGFNTVGSGFKQRLSVEVADTTGFATMFWFSRANWAMKSLEVGKIYRFFGKPSFYNSQLQIVHPEFEIAGVSVDEATKSVEGVYGSTEKLNSEGLGSKAQWKIVRAIWSEAKDSIKENLPPYLIEHMRLMGRKDAFFQVHFPQSAHLLKAALFRLKFEELLALQINMIQNRRKRLSGSLGYKFDKVGDAFNRFYKEKLPFPLTGAQKRVIKEIRADMGSGHQMNRLLQGDVGSGKTIVALMSALIAIDNGYQAAIMAPTEILAQQHYASIGELCSGLGVRVRLLTGTTKQKDRKVILEELSRGTVELLIGTHTLIEEPVQFIKLGFVVIDEQHRFGVQQRAKLWNKSITPPHVLVMTATPIPRTLAMTIYGDLDVSKIDELPPGRKVIQTLSITESLRLRLVGFLKEEIKKGRQIYVVFPLISESEKMDYANLEQGAELLRYHFPAPEYSTVVVHGKMKPQEKEYGMRLFTGGQVDILISTTVIEVGVNVPNASVMVIESAEKFGLSQLHQLRGRVGRGAEQSYCVLVTADDLSKDSKRRIEAMCKTSDGFELAEMDMEIRGIGDLEGTRQSGQAMDLKMTNLSRDAEILEKATEQAEIILNNDPKLEHPQNQMLRDLIDESKRVKASVNFSKIS